MKSKKQLVNKIVESLKSEVDDWDFDNYTASNKKSGIEIWIANIPILSTSIYKPTHIRLGLFNAIKVHKALSECRNLKLIKLMSNDEIK